MIPRSITPLERSSPRQEHQPGYTVHSKELSAHLQVDQYGTFRLTDAIRPSLDLQVVPREGFRMDIFRDSSSGLQVPVLAASVSRERLFDVFLGLVGSLSDVVDVVLETSHHTSGNV